MSGSAPNLTPGHRYCEGDDCFNIIPDDGVEDLCSDCSPVDPKRATRPTSFREFIATPSTGPTYTDLAREVDRLREELQQARRDAAAVVVGCRHGKIRQQAFLELAHELAEMEPAARDAAIRRIIDNAQ